MESYECLRLYYMGIGANMLAYNTNFALYFLQSGLLIIFNFLYRVLVKFCFLYQSCFVCVNHILVVELVPCRLCGLVLSNLFLIILQIQVFLWPLACAASQASAKWQPGCYQILHHKLLVVEGSHCDLLHWPHMAMLIIEELYDSADFKLVLPELDGDLHHIHVPNLGVVTG